ncbi:tyrosine-type recombinase/integrase [Porcincola intestinalis]|uniref:tyrosine-type recombinase/integrase n=1 Tax=Porcincola intestinalis TaxID=2606632 RepID=UPI002A91C767|nr:tyrosine-type recombinase/integrase [Porcincola intestinalis]MDY5578400.1 tyrosine-type recombinase/integrase [Porcincola intestinalis]
MQKIIELKMGNEIYYKCQEIQDSTVITERNIFCKTATIKKGKVEYFMFYNSEMCPISDAFAYVNQTLADKSHNTRIKAGEALKVLFCFEEIVGKRLQSFTSTDVDSLKYFLHGYLPSGQTMILDLQTIRSNDTVNGYLSVYRKYLESMGITDHILFSTTGRVRFSNNTLNYDTAAASVNYRKNDRSPKKVIEVPRYISVDEFSSIIKYVREHYTKREEAIIRLMYQCGLRIGEVLGLTADDLVNEKQPNGTYAAIAYLRNRVSDNKDQLAKTCMKVFSVKQYQTDEYKTDGYGFQTVVVPGDLYDLINEYIEETHSAARNGERSQVRYYNKTIADRVRPATDYEDDNYYIFINSVGTRLSAASWNTVLRDIFVGVGIAVDKDKRKNNLNHRFRHGYAMFNVMYLGVKEIELARLLRHSSTASVLCYYQPTISDQIKLKTDFAESLYDIVPSLKRDK